MTYESLDDALADLVKDLGGPKRVGPLLWPAKDPDAAARLLADCFNADRPARLSPEQAMFVMRLGRQAGKHKAIDWLLAELHYAPTRPVDPRDEVAGAAGLRRRGRLLLRHRERARGGHAVRQGADRPDAGGADRSVRDGVLHDGRINIGPIR